MSDASSKMALRKGQASGMRFALLQALFNEKYTTRLLRGARSRLLGLGAKAADLKLEKVPGAFELPLAAKELASSGRFDAVICLGAVIRGETSHYDLVCESAASGILRAGLDTGVPVLFGVITCDNEAQALARCGSDRDNAGRHAAEAGVHMVSLLKKVRHGN